MNKKGAMELSVSTIVIIVLAMAMLIGGLVLVKKIISGATSVVDLGNDQLLNQMRNLFGEDRDLGIYPDTKLISMKQDELNGFGVGIKNRGPVGKFSYEVIVSDPDLQKKCNVDNAKVISWIQSGRAENDISLGPGADTVRKVLLKVPKGSAICNFRLGITLKKDGIPIASEAVDIDVK